VTYETQVDLYDRSDTSIMDLQMTTVTYRTKVTPTWTYRGL